MSSFIRQLGEMTDDVYAGKSAAQIFSKQKKKLAERSLEEKYYLVRQLSDQIGPMRPRLDLIYHLVKMPSFVYDKNRYPALFLGALAGTSYWLDRELFDTRAIRQRSQSAKTAERYAHIRLLDIGSILLDKGFPLSQETLSDVWTDKTAPPYTWARTFFEQCRQRNAFLKRVKITHRKKMGQIATDRSANERT